MDELRVIKYLWENLLRGNSIILVPNPEHESLPWLLLCPGSMALH